jgi:hypothetical protein
MVNYIAVFHYYGINTICHLFVIALYYIYGTPKLLQSTKPITTTYELYCEVNVGFHFYFVSVLCSSVIFSFSH